MTPRTPVLVAALAALAIGTARGQTCTEPHYRWSEKIDTSFAHQTPTDLDVSDMLAWTPRTVTAKDKCAKRIGREKHVYAVTAYVRRIKLRESDRRLSSGARCRHDARIRPHEPVRVQVLGFVLAIERPRRRVLWIHIDANASRLTAREPCRER